MSVTPYWKTSNGRYITIHNWVKKNLGKPDTCTKCGKRKLRGREIHWANVSGEYKKELNDWARLCARCHWLMDKDNYK